MSCQVIAYYAIVIVTEEVVTIHTQVCVDRLSAAEEVVTIHTQVCVDRLSAAEEVVTIHTQVCAQLHSSCVAVATCDLLFKKEHIQPTYAYVLAS